MRDFLETMTELRQRGESFAVATVVARRAPVSAHLGDRAIVLADGRMDGFVGGACSREIVRKQALAAIRARRACLVSIRPDAAEASASDPEHVIVPMTCVSEGAIDVYVEPFVPARRLMVVGATPVADALSRTALSLDYEVVRIVAAREAHDLEAAASTLGFTLASLESLDDVVRRGKSDTVIVVASQGHYDEQALEIALACGVEYVGLVASRKRGAVVLEDLRARGVAAADRVHIPAGLDLGARTAPEVALSILAEIVKLRPSQTGSVTYVGQGFRLRERSGGLVAAPAESDGSGAEAVSPVGDPVHPARDLASPVRNDAPATAEDPVCHMDVEVATARHIADVGGTTYYFCCAHCRTQFLEQPARYLSHAGGEVR